MSLKPEFPPTQRSSERRRNVSKQTPRRRPWRLNLTTTIPQERLKAGAKTWFRKCGIGCGAQPDPIANGFP
jgi:hypothetical protein